MDQDPTSLYKELYHNFYSEMQPESIPDMILHLADYQYKNAFVADPELNMVACLSEIMTKCRFK